MLKKVLIPIFFLIAIVVIVIVLEKGKETKPVSVDKVGITTKANPKLTNASFEDKNLLDGVDISAIEKAEIYLVAKKVTITEQSKIKKLIDYMQNIQLGKENKTFDGYGNLGDIHLYDKSGEILSLYLVGAPYVGVKHGDLYGFYMVRQYDGDGEYCEDFRKLFKKLKKSK